MRADSYRIMGVAERYSEAVQLLAQPGDCAIVQRGSRFTQLVIRCPDGCGAVLSINLDPRSGPAWRMYKRNDTWSLYPSVDRSTGCLSHFIFWNGRILWTEAPEDVEPELMARLTDAIMGAMPALGSASYVEIADTLGEDPWDTLAACRFLAKRERVVEGTGRMRGIFSIRSE